MEPLNTIVTIAVGLIVRLGVPIALTALFIFVLRRLDERWQAQAKGELLAVPMVRNSGCWDVKNCTSEQKKHCGAYAHQDVPCWQYFRSQQGNLRETCLGCDVFRTAPIPVTA
jgi:hypothetical protein